MIASHHDSEITFYEELGLTRGATPEEIRDAFRLNVRLLHPDQQTDPQLKEIAEAQMRKLNRIYAVLSDPARRRDYDELLDDEFGPPLIMNTPLPDLGRLRARLLWGAAIAISAGLLIWLASDSTPAVQSRTADSGPTAQTPVSSSPSPPSSSAAAPATDAAEPPPSPYEVAQLRAALRGAIAERDAAVHELDKLRGISTESRPAFSLPQESAVQNPPLTITELPSAPKLPAFAPVTPPRVDKQARPEKPVNRQMGGFWFYARPPQGQVNKNQTLYPPEYIEATISEDGSLVHGSFRARYVIVDRAISPDVNFTFNGTQNGAQLSAAFNGAGGAKGDLTLKLTSENSLRIDWNASELGSFGLSSGTAVLTRRIE